MKSHLLKQFFPVDNAMELYERFHALKQRSASLEGYISAFDNLLIWVVLNENNEQLASHYLSKLHSSIRDEMEVVRLYILEAARQYALMAEKRL